MKLSENGLRLIKSFEGYHTRTSDGGCHAYKCPAGVWTCGWGCTEGVTANTRWTEAEATERLAAEIAKFEAIVLKHVNVQLNQNQFDALVSFAYNVGEGREHPFVSGFSTSTLLKRLNLGDALGAANEFPKWKSGGGHVLKGLVNRRAREQALFMKPMEAPEAPAMPQAVDPPLSPPEAVQEMKAKSRKWSIIGFLRWLVGVPTAVQAIDASGVMSSIDVPQIQENLNAFQTVAGSLGKLGWIGWGLLVLVGLTLVRKYMVEDAETGRAVPSGMEDGTESRAPAA